MQQIHLDNTTLMPNLKTGPDNFKSSNSASGSKTRVILSTSNKDPKRNSTYFQPEVIITKVEKHHQSLKGSMSKVSNSRHKQSLQEIGGEEIGTDQND
jgi:hypothetical protein